MKKNLLLLLLTVIMLSCNNTPEYNDPIPPHDNFRVYSELLNETRFINVWTPPNYKNSNVALPVLYMPDGGIVKEDFPHIANTVAKLVENKSIPPLILVGIENTDRGRDLTGFSEVKEDEQYCPLTNGAKFYRSFIINELMPVINSKYRTTDQKGIIGESLAGLFVMETFLIKPKTFDFYIAMDPSLWWNNHYLEQNAAKFLQKLPNEEKRLWFASSDAKDISVYTKSIAKTIENTAPEQLIWKYSDEPDEKHNTIFRATKEKALTWIFNTK